MIKTHFVVAFVAVAWQNALMGERAGVNRSSRWLHNFCHSFSIQYSILPGKPDLRCKEKLGLLMMISGEKQLIRTSRGVPGGKRQWGSCPYQNSIFVAVAGGGGRFFQKQDPVAGGGAVFFQEFLASLFWEAMSDPKKI